MANDEHLKILKQGAETWNKWRRDQIDIPNESIANLNDIGQSDSDLIIPDLSDADLRHAHLGGTDLRGADLSDVDLRGVDLSGANLRGANLHRANLSDAVLFDVDLSNATLVDTNLTGTALYGANFRGACLTNANLAHAKTFDTNYTAIDLSEATGLDTVEHHGPSSIGIDTLYKSQGKIPEKFLRDAGVPEEVIALLPSIRAGDPIQYDSCFISYSGKDEAFAKKLHSRMQKDYMRVWFAPEDMKGGRKVHEQLQEAIQVQDKLLLVLSPDSIHSLWVAEEIRRARQAEKKENRRKLFPIPLTDYKTLQDWELMTSDGENLAEEVRQYYSPDFSNWSDKAAFEREFKKLKADLMKP